VEAVSDVMLHKNANHGGLFATSREGDALVDDAHATLAAFLGTDDPATVIFGANMTTLTLHFSRSLARTWRPGDEVIVTRLDHDANVTPWVLAARDAGATVRYVRFHPEDGRLDLDDFRRQLSDKTRLVAVGCASNALGTINPFREIIQEAHAAGAEVYLDAVHYAPHALIDVREWEVDYLACSPYKFFGPHVGVLWGRRERLEQLEAYKLRPAPNELPGKWMTGTQNHAAIVGAAAGVRYLASIGLDNASSGNSLREQIVRAWRRINDYERWLGAKLIAGLKEVPGVRVWGITDPDRFDQRVPTVCITHKRLTSHDLATRLGERGIFAWHGNFYAIQLTESLRLEPVGFVRLGLLHYNTEEEIERLITTLGELG
jgi:cysteine desulfurase family protein (TIGR01976 family)